MAVAGALRVGHWPFGTETYLDERGVDDGVRRSCIDRNVISLESGVSVTDYG